MTTASEYLTIKEAADLLGLSDTTVRRMIRRRELRSFRAGERRIVLRREDVLAQIKEVTPDGQDYTPVGAEAV